jgi:hypothetical protein
MTSAFAAPGYTDIQAACCATIFVSAITATSAIFYPSVPFSTLHHEDIATDQFWFAEILCQKLYR